jgi:hypothetical protein
MRATARLFTQVQLVPHLFSRTGAAGTDSRRREVELVKILQKSIADFQICNLKLAI